MRGRRIGLGLLAAAILATAGLVAYVVLLSPHRLDLATILGFVWAVFAAAAGGLVWVWRRWKRYENQEADLPKLDQIADELADAVWEQWYEEAKSRKLLWPEPIPVRWLPLSGAAVSRPEDAAKSTRFAPLPGLQLVDAQLLRDGRGRGDLHAVYGGLGSGRLVIAGAAGSGKTGAAVLLVLDALDHRRSIKNNKDRSKVPVPVMFTLDGWDPNAKKVEDWLNGQLQRAYSFLRGKDGPAKVARLLAAKDKIAVILDGFDEVPEKLRPTALEALNDQASFRVVLLTRSDEMITAAKEEQLDGAVAIELQVIDPETAANYLTSAWGDQPPDGWQEFISRIRSDPETPLAQALSSPLALTLTRDTYRGANDLHELVAIADSEPVEGSDDHLARKIIDHLLDQVLPAAYKPRPGVSPPRYDLDTALRALTKIAQKMNEEVTRNLEWWQLPEWSNWEQRRGPTVGLVIGMLTWLVDWLVFRNAFWSGFWIGAMVGSLSALATRAPDSFWRRNRGIPPWQTGRMRIRWAPIRIPLALVLTSALLLSPVGALLGWLAVRNVIGIVLGIVAVLASISSVGLWVVLPRLGDPGDASSASPLTSWRTARRYGRALSLVFGLLGGLCGAVLFGLTGWWAGAFVTRRVLPQIAADWISHLSSQDRENLARHHYTHLAQALTRQLTADMSGPFGGLKLALAWALFGGLIGGLLVGLLSGLRAPVAYGTWPSWLAMIEFSVRWHIPVRLMPFLEDAHKRGILRTVGPAYQFRHSRLQDRLAQQATSSARDPDKFARGGQLGVQVFALLFDDDGPLVGVVLANRNDDVVRLIEAIVKVLPKGDGCGEQAPTSLRPGQESIPAEVPAHEKVSWTWDRQELDRILMGWQLKRGDGLQVAVRTALNEEFGGSCVVQGKPEIRKLTRSWRSY